MKRMLKRGMIVGGCVVATAVFAEEVNVGPCLWVEAEAYVSQTGSGAPRYNMAAASDGACVDNGWGGKEGHSLCYQVDLQEALDRLFVTVRYARESEGDASMKIILDGDPQRAVTLVLPSTGDWGFKPDGWRYAAVRLPAAGQGAHKLEFRALADGGNVNVDGFYLSRAELPADSAALALPPTGPEALAPLKPSLTPLPCKTPVGLPYSKLKAFVAGSGLVQTFEYNPDYGGMGNNRLGPSLHVLLAGQGPWTKVEQTLVCEPVPKVVTRLIWPAVTMEQSVFAAAPEERGFCVRVQVTNTGKETAAYELVDVVGGAGGTFTGKALKRKDGRTILSAAGIGKMLIPPEARCLPGPLGGVAHLRHTFSLAPGASGKLDLQFLGEPAPVETLLAEAAKVWSERLRPVARVTLPDATLQYAFDASVRYMLAMIEWRPDHARILKGLQHYYGSNPYDTFQVSRTLDQIGLQADAVELLRHQLRHLKEGGIFEMWERNALTVPGVEQWIVQGLAAAALWGHYELWGDEAWLKEMTPALVKAASSTLRARAGHAGPRQQGNVTIEGLLPPCAGDGGLGGGYHWSQNAGPLYGTRVAAEAARLLGLAEAGELEAGNRAFRESLAAVRLRAVAAAGSGALPAFAGAEGEARFKSLWGVVMSVTTFGSIPPDDPAAVATLRFLQNSKRDGLHRFLGYSNGTWPYLSAEVAQWHILLGEYEEAWTILKPITERASPTACWYEEFAEAGCGDPCDIWSAAEQVYLSRLLLVCPKGDDLLLCAGLPSAYMAPGKQAGATDMPLPGGGRCSFSLAFESGRAKAEVSLTGAKRPARLRVWLLPTEASAEPEVKVTGAGVWKRQGREVILEQPSDKVTIAVNFSN